MLANALKFKRLGTIFKVRNNKKFSSSTCQESKFFQNFETWVSTIKLKNAFGWKLNSLNHLEGKNLSWLISGCWNISDNLLFFVQSVLHHFLRILRYGKSQYLHLEILFKSTYLKKIIIWSHNWIKSLNVILYWLV